MSTRIKINRNGEAHFDDRPQVLFLNYKFKNYVGIITTTM